MIHPPIDVEDAPLSVQELGKLKWRCRRGLLENDLFIARFFERHEAGLTRRQALALQALTDLPDNDLLDLLLSRKEPDPTWAGPDVTAVLETMRADGAHRLGSDRAPSTPFH